MYEIADPSPLPAKPDLPGTVILRGTADEAIDAAAADLFLHATNCVRSFGDFHIAMAVDAGAEPLLFRLMYDPPYRDLPWKRTHLWLVDEFATPREESLRRAALLHELVVNPSDIPPNQVHTIDIGTESPAEDYEAQLREHLGWREKGHDRLDYVLIGPDVQAAAPQNPRRPAQASSVRLVSTVPAEPSVDRSPRVSMTPAIISAARFIGAVALGPLFRPVLARAVARDATTLHPDDPRRVLFSANPTLGGELRWYLDAVACPPAGGAVA